MPYGHLQPHVFSAVVYLIPRKTTDGNVLDSSLIVIIWSCEYNFCYFLSVRLGSLVVSTPVVKLTRCFDIKYHFTRHPCDTGCLVCNF